MSRFLGEEELLGDEGELKLQGQNRSTRFAGEPHQESITRVQKEGDE